MQTEVTLQADCEGTRIPSGQPVILHQGQTLTVTQALGGSVTLRDEGGLYRIAPEFFASLGEDLAERVRASAMDVAAENVFSEDQVWTALKQCFDPEIPVNIVDLGLIYDLNCEALDGGQYAISVKMTLTAQGCGMGPTIAEDAKSKIEQIPTVDRANVEIVWDPVWTPHMISDEGRGILGLS